MWNESAKRTNDLFQQIHFSNIQSDSYESITHEILYYCSDVKKGKFLEVGCGNGLLLRNFVTVFSEVYGVDLSDELVEVAKKEVPQAKIFISEGKNLNFPDNTFDCAVANSIYQYFPDEKYALEVTQEMLRVVKRGGKIYIGDVYNLGLKSIYERYYRYKNTSIIERAKMAVKKVLYTFSNKRNLFDYLYLEPNFFITNFTRIAYVTPKLIISKKPELFRIFRFDVLIEKI
jgi:ubiquinone/menaquinone biosynthesis C-methylase UbiE